MKRLKALDNLDMEISDSTRLEEGYAEICKKAWRLYNGIDEQCADEVSCRSCDSVFENHSVFGNTENQPERVH